MKWNSHDYLFVSAFLRTEFTGYSMPVEQVRPSRASIQKNPAIFRGISISQTQLVCI